MQLFYRGHQYQRNTSQLNAKEVTIVGKYRGNQAEIHQFATAGLRSKSAQLTYRGVKL